MLEQLLGVPLTLASFLVMISVVVFVHELGHFVVARRCGVRVDRFSIGFGPELWGFNDRHGTRWRFSLIPLGGYVAMYGEANEMDAVQGKNEQESSRASARLTPEQESISLKHKTVGQRAAIVFAGPAVNFLFAIAVFFSIFLVFGKATIDPVVGEVIEKSAAAEAGLMPGDRIIAIDGDVVSAFADVQRQVQLGYGDPVELIILRDRQELPIRVTPRIVEREDAFGNIQKMPLIGITAAGDSRTVERMGPTAALIEAFKETYGVVEATGIAVGQMITGQRGTEDLGGPIRIAKYSGQAARVGLGSFIILMAILSVNLGLINLLPVPLLDGGHLLFYAIEAVRGRPLSERAQEWGFRIGLALVGTLIVFVMWNDVVHL